MEDILLIDAAERFANGEMSKEEQIYFEDLRKNNPELDQAVVEQLFFLKQFTQYGQQQAFIKNLHLAEQNLAETGQIASPSLNKPAILVSLWHKSKRTIAVAACIAGVVSIFITSVLSSLQTKNNSSNLTPLVVKLNQTDQKTQTLESKVSALEAAVPEPVKARIESKFRATGFMIDATNNYLVTNAHVINEAKNHLIVENNNGEQYTAKVVYLNKDNDIAIVKIEDDSFKKLPALPYNFKKGEASLGEHIYVLGYPKQEIVYTEGYVSAKNGYLMDTSFCQLVTLANVGNSGSPVVNKNGDIIGVVSSRETDDAGVVFAIKSANILRAAERVRMFDGSKDIKVGGTNLLKGLDRETQIKKVQDYVFMIKGN